MTPTGPIPTDLFARLALQRSQASLNTALERLATGSRINRASDDPAGAIALDRLSARQRTIDESIERIEFDQHRYGTIDGGLSVVSDLAAELNGIVVAAANDGLSDAEKEALQMEADSIIDAIDHIAGTTVFNGQRVLAGASAAELGTAVGEGLSLASLSSGGELDLLSGDLDLAQDVVRAATSEISARRSAVGSLMRRGESEIRALQGELEGVVGAASRIGDGDIARETAELVRGRILERAAIASILIAGDARKRALELLAPSS